MTNASPVSFDDLSEHEKGRGIFTTLQEVQAAFCGNPARVQIAEEIRELQNFKKEDWMDQQKKEHIMTAARNVSVRINMWILAHRDPQREPPKCEDPEAFKFRCRVLWWDKERRNADNRVVHPSDVKLPPSIEDGFMVYWMGAMATPGGKLDTAWRMPSLNLLGKTITEELGLETDSCEERSMRFCDKEQTFNRTWTTKPESEVRLRRADEEVPEAKEMEELYQLYGLARDGTKEAQK